MKKILVSLLLVGCASDDGDGKFIDGFRPPPPGDGEIQFIAPPVRNIEPGKDITICAYLDERVASDLDIFEYHGYQSTLGAHHTILYAVQQTQAANAHECTEDDMVNSRYLGGAGADTPPAVLPEGVVFRMPGNTQLMIQTHWINASDKPIDGQGAFTLKVTDPKPEHQTAQLFTVPNTNLSLPVGVGSAFTECRVREDMNVFLLGGHMHEWGTHVKITHTPASGSGANVVYDHGWAPEDIFAPPLNNYTTANPFVLHKDDKVRVDCTYNNTTGAPLLFPSEMCVAFTYAYPMTKQIDCVDGNWPN